MVGGIVYMELLSTVYQEHPEYKVLINAVISRIGLNSIESVNKGGIDSGFSRFIYHTDTYKFSMLYRRFIIKLLNEEFKELGYHSRIIMIADFRVFKKASMTWNEEMNCVDYLNGAQFIYNDRVTNVLAWYAAETVCRWFEND